jgi:hypothetical protein
LIYLDFITFTNRYTKIINMESNEDFGEKDIKNVDDTYSGNIKGNILSLIRTTQRNYIDLTTIADNKAHILISINSLMLTILLPLEYV